MMREFIVRAILILVAAAASDPAFAAEGDDFLVYNRLDRERFSSGAPVRLSVCVKNVSSARASFKIYDGGPQTGDYLSFQPVVFDSQGNEAESIVPYKMKNRTLKEISGSLRGRMIELEPGEVFTHPMDLTGLYRLQKDTPYRVRSFFFPDILKEAVVLKSSNELALVVSDRGLGTIKTGVMRERREDVPDRRISPSEVVVIHLLAEKNREMDRFIKYVKVSRFINSYSDYVRLYQRADDDEKRAIEDDFVNYISRERDDHILDFKIIQEEVESNSKISYVDVVVDRFSPRKTKRYRYRYMLEREENYWLITGLEATIMKGIAR